MLLFSIGFLIFFSIIAYLITVDKLILFDRAIISIVQGFEQNGLTSVMKFFSFIGSTKSVVVITILSACFLYFALGHRRELILLGITIVGSTGLNIMLKLIFERARPDINVIAYAHGYSFPSGHSMAAFSLYGILTYLLWRHLPRLENRILLLLMSSFMILAIGISRIYLGVHYPSDVIGAYAISASWLFLLITLFRKRIIAT